MSGLSLLSDSDCESLTDDVINYDPDFDLCAGRKEIVRLHTEPVFKVCAIVAVFRELFGIVEHK